LIDKNYKELTAALIDAEELYQNSPCGYVSFLPDGNVIKINKTLLDWIGYKEDEVLYKLKFSDLLSKGGNMHFQMFFMPMVTVSGSVKELNYEIFRSNHTTFPTLISASAVRDSSGMLLAINAAIIDITERKQYENDLLIAKRHAETEKNRFAFLADLTPEMIWTADNDGSIDYINQRCMLYFDLGENELLNNAEILQRVHPDDRLGLIRSWLKSSKSGSLFQTEARLENRNKVHQWHIIRAEPNKNVEGAISKWFGSCANIDEQVLALQLKDEFISIASHELKTPMTSLKAYLQILNRQDLPEKAKTLVTKAALSLSNLQFLISSLLDVSVINSGPLALNLSRFLIHDLIKECIELVSLNFRSHVIRINVEENINIYVYADRQRIIQVMINLISNAIKYSPGAEFVQVTIEKDLSDKFVKIAVQDFGIGISPEKLDLIFDKYYRVKDKDLAHTTVTGLGLGLYIIQNIVRLHGSKVYAESTIHKGSVFHFSLYISGSATVE
jgi:PAS domain S-box-containing protein